MANKVYKNAREQVEDISKDPKVKNKDEAISKAIQKWLESKKDHEKLPELRSIFAGPGGKKHIQTFVGKPQKVQSVVNEKFGEDLEPNYFWLIGFLRDDQKVKSEQLIKVVDTYSASEASSFHRNMGQSLGAMQDRVIAALRGIGELTRQIFRFSYELKILEERLGLYTESKIYADKNPWDGDLKKLDPNPAEVTLKDRYINLVEGGPKNPSSVYGLGTQVGFILIPDLFLRIDVFSKEDVDRAKKNLERAGLNKKVIEVVTRKLSAYFQWRSATEKHLRHRWKFLLTYLKQHYNSIKLNIQWMKPYLQAAKRMQWNEKNKESVDILAAIEQAVLQVEVLAKVKKFEKYWSVTNLDMYFRSSPETQYVPQARGDITRHTGRYELIISSRVMTDEQVIAYKFLKEIEDFEMIMDIEQGLNSALGEFEGSVKEYIAVADQSLVDFDKYYAQKEADKKKKDKIVVKDNSGPLEMVKDLGRGFYEMGDSLMAIGSWKRSAGETPGWKMKGAQGAAASEAMKQSYEMYKSFKKAKQMIQF